MVGIYRTEKEKDVSQEITRIFESNPESADIKLDNFPKYVRRNQLKRFIAMYELYKMILPVKGSIVECGVFRGFGLMSWAKLSTILEPENLTRRIYGFDTFGGFPSVAEGDLGSDSRAVVGGLCADSYDELSQLIDVYDQDRFLGHIPKVQLVKGDIAHTAPQFLEENPHLVVSMLFLDADLYEPTKVALETFLPRMPKGSLLVFDELDNPIWPGETRATLETLGLRNLELRRLEWDPYISWAVV